MRLDLSREPITADDPTIRSSLVDVPIPQLVAAVAQLTGEYTLLRNEYRPDAALMLTLFDDGYTPESRSLALDAVADALIRFRDRCRAPAPRPRASAKSW